jgi:hypothetical protein
VVVIKAFKILEPISSAHSGRRTMLTCPGVKTLG